MSTVTRKAKSTKAAPMTFSAFVVTYATDKGIDDVTKAGKRLRSKIRNSYGKNDAVTKWIDGQDKQNKDGNRYKDVTPATAKVLLSL